MLSIYQQNKSFFLGFFAIILSALFILLSYTKPEGFYLLNFYHTGFLTYFFIYVTYLGDGIFCIAIGLLLLLFRKRLLGLMVLASYVVSGIIAQVLKYYIVEPRPAILLKDSAYPYFIDDVTLHNLHAFPSGHTASAFALAAALSFYADNKNYSLLFLCVAIIVGYSRIYLAQHFLGDVFAGAILGVISSIACKLLLENTFLKMKFVNGYLPANQKT